ncbi:MAG: MoxR family ATPase [Myxococcota bacterium]
MADTATAPHPFSLIDPADRSAARQAALDARTLPRGLLNLTIGARHYQPSAELLDAIHVALAVGAPLLLTGEPGTGKTQVAHYLAWYFDTELFSLFVRSTTAAEDLFYRFDAVAYLHLASDPAHRDPADRSELAALKARLIAQGKGPLWRAYDAERTTVVLIDEIDKAPRDFPNDLLNAIDQHQFYVKELDQTIECGERPPIMVITSNSERRLPEPFLRRCIVHHIEFDEDLVRRVVAARRGDFPDLDPALCEVAIARFMELRSRDLRKPPATAELLTWLVILSLRDDASFDILDRAPLHELPALSALIKDRDDRAMLR